MTRSLRKRTTVRRSLFTRLASSLMLVILPRAYAANPGVSVRGVTAAVNSGSVSVVASWWQRADPLTLAVLGAILTILGNIVIGYFNHRASIKQSRMKADDDLALERTKAKFNLILQAIATDDSKIAERNIDFFIGAGLLEDSNGSIRHALNQFNPVLPSAGAASHSRSKSVPPSDLSRIYGFPDRLLGNGQHVGILEFGGGYRQKDLDKHFSSQHLATPKIVDISVDGAKNSPGGASVDGQVLSDIQIVAAIAPQAALRIYFAPYVSTGWVSAIRKATADKVSVLLIGWGGAECTWKAEEVRDINDALKQAALSGITVVCAAGDQGTTNGIDDGLRHVTFPASSPWVTGVGGTSLQSKSGRFISEVAWNDDGGATGGGVSELFDCPDWQSSVKVPRRANGTAGRGVPDVSAVAWNTLVLVSFGSYKAAIGGTTVSAAIWAGLIARINQGLNNDLGFLNPRLYQAIGPAGILHPILKGHNGVKSVEGYFAGPGWNPVGGWGSPDGLKLLNWLKEHPDIAGP
ncbi:MAG TPA: S53 family peptidase [Edaphobacter sp.]|nr:S53 family peptidase [Edaphobacter sp.]